MEHILVSQKIISILLLKLCLWGILVNVECLNLSEKPIFYFLNFWRKKKAHSKSRALCKETNMQHGEMCPRNYVNAELTHWRRLNSSEWLGALTVQLSKTALSPFLECPAIFMKDCNKEHHSLFTPQTSSWLSVFIFPSSPHLFIWIYQPVLQFTCLTLAALKSPKH